MAKKGTVVYSSNQMYSFRSFNDPHGVGLPVRR